MIGTDLTEIYNRLQRFTMLLDKAYSYQESILKFSINSSWESLEFMTLNRDRLNNIIQREQEYLFIRFEKYKKSSGINSEVQHLILAWQNDTSEWIKKSKVVDENILVSLKMQKSDTSKEISKLYKSKCAHKGYSLRK